MKIGSLNIRGLGSSIKRDEVRAFFFSNNLVFCCVQETKIESFSNSEGKAIWGSSSVKWCARGSRGRAGGLLSFWDESKFSSTSQWTMEGAVVVNGRWRFTGDD